MRIIVYYVCVYIVCSLAAWISLFVELLGYMDLSYKYMYIGICMYTVDKSPSEPYGVE